MQTEKEFDGFTHMNEYMPLLLPPLKHLLMTRGIWPFTHDKTSLSLIHPPIANIYLSSSFLLPLSPQIYPIPIYVPFSSQSKLHIKTPTYSQSCHNVPHIQDKLYRLRAQEDVRRPPTRPSKGLQKRRSQTHHCRTLQRLLGCLYRREEEIRSWR
jgi:hypothetical protein